MPFFFFFGNASSVGWSEVVHKARSKGVCKEQSSLGIALKLQSVPLKSSCWASWAVPVHLPSGRESLIREMSA